MKVASAQLISIFLFSAGADAFAPAPSSKTSTPSTELNLLPNQGCQLAAAAAAAAYEKKDEETSVGSKNSNASTPTNAARELAKRIFNLPSQVLRIPEDSTSKRFPFELIADHELDEVVYPVVGFQFVKLDNGSMRAVPSPNALNACNFNNIHKSKKEPVYGWFSPACHLGDSYADDGNYCTEPNQNEAGNSTK